jgi:hypothetical protein
MARPPLGHNTGGNFLPDSLLYIRSSVALLLILRRVNSCLGDLPPLSSLLLLLLLLSGRSFHSMSAWVNLLFIDDNDDWSLILSRLLLGLPAAKRSVAAAAAGSLGDLPMNNGECTTAVIIFLFCNALSTTEGDTTKASDDDIHFLLLDDAATAAAASRSSTSDVSR